METALKIGKATHGVSLVRGEPFAFERTQLTKGAIAALRPLFPKDSPETILDEVVDRLKDHLKQKPRELEAVIKAVIPAKWSDLEALTRIDKRSVVPRKFELRPSDDLRDSLIEYLRAKRDNKLPDFNPTRLIHAWARWLWQTGNSAIESWDFEVKLPEHVRETRFKRSVSALGFTFANCLHKALEIICSAEEKELKTLRERAGFVMESHRLQEFLGKGDARGFIKHIIDNKLEAITDPRDFRKALYYDQRSLCIKTARSLLPELDYFFSYDEGWLKEHKNDEGLRNVISYEAHQKTNEVLGEFSPKELTLKRLIIENQISRPDAIHIIYSKNVKTDLKRIQAVLDSFADDIFHNFPVVITGRDTKESRLEKLSQLRAGSKIIISGVKFPEDIKFPSEQVVFYRYSALPRSLTEYPWVRELREKGIHVHQIPIHKINTTDTGTRARF